MTWVAAAVGGSAVLGYLGSQNAADKQLQGVQAGIDAQKAMFDTQNAQQAPYRSSGYGALNKINSMMGGQYLKYDPNGNPVGLKPTSTTIGNGVVSTGNLLSDLAVNTASQAVNGQSNAQTPDLTNAESDYLTHQFNAQDFQNGIDPGYAWRLKMGQDQASRQANLGGGAISGNSLAGLQDYTQGQASQEYGNAFNRYQTQRGNIYNTLASIAGLGQTSLGQTTQAGTQAGSNLASLNVAGGNAAAGGIAAGTSALTGALNTGGQYAFLKNLQQNNQTPTGYGQPVQTSPDINLA
jgi:hypothetical protein